MTGALGWSLLGAAVLVAPGLRPAGVDVAGPSGADPAGRGARAVFAARWLPRRATRLEPDRTLPLVLDLVAAALRSGRPLADALALAAPAGAPRVSELLDRVATLSRLGADAEQAWSCVPRDGPLGEVARVAVRSAASGRKLASGFERLAGETRAARAAAAAVRAHRAAVTAMAPLAACFLPSFVCLGVVPVIVGVARSAFAVLP